MRNHLTFGYCTNVHAGVDLETAKANLLQFAAPVRQLVCPGGKLPVGLWLAEDAARSLTESNATADFAQWLNEHQFSAYTFNGFPQGDFHQSVVKHAVYLPTWCDIRRRDYTLTLARILDGLLPAGEVGTISTLPLGWPTPKWTEDAFQLAAENLRFVARQLAELASQTGREIVIAIEPEPGCVLNTAHEMEEFFSQYLFGQADEAAVRRHIGVCHDICHSGVMFEPQVEALELYRSRGIRIGKVQVSSAVHVPWDKCTSQAAAAGLLEQLKTFNEPKYLHQTSRSQAGRLLELSDDLPLALQAWVSEAGTPGGPGLPDEPWRVHFHVPIFVNQFGAMQTTQSDIVEATQYLEMHRDMQLDSSPWFVGHYEVETYAWPVLPASLATENLPTGIAQELEYFRGVLAANARPES